MICCELCFTAFAAFGDTLAEVKVLGLQTKNAADDTTVECRCCLAYLRCIEPAEIAAVKTQPPTALERQLNADVTIERNDESLCTGLVVYQKQAT